MAVFSAGQLQQFLKFSNSLLQVRVDTLPAAIAATMTTPITFLRPDPITGGLLPVQDTLAYLQSPKMENPAPKEEITLLVPLLTDGAPTEVAIGDQFTYDGWSWSINDRATEIVDGVPAAITLRAARLAILGAATVNSLTTTATVTLTAANGAIVATDLKIQLQPASTAERIGMDGGLVAYTAVAMPPIDLAENARLLVTDCPGNPYLVSAKPYLVTDVRQRGQPSPATLFAVSVKQQP